MSTTYFSRIDKLMEQGMCRAMARRMMDTVNRTISDTEATDADTASAQKVPAPAKESWYTAVSNHLSGPLSYSQLKTLASNGCISGDTLMWSPGMTAWKRAADIPFVSRLLIISGCTM